MAAKGRRTETPEVRRAQVLDAAKSCFRDKGIHPTRMVDIAERAGISVGLVYRYFPSKKAVIEEIVRDDFTRQREFFETLFAAHPDDPIAAIEAGTADFARSALDRDRTILMMEIASEVARNPDMRACDAETRQQVYDLFRAQLKKGARRMDKAEAEARVQLLGALVTGLGIQLAIQTGSPNPALFGIMDEVVKNILSPEPRPSV
ncbi:TetR/AcrR family transcriptional regulator [Sphingosinicella rhizophila]|uniref:TetR/AcrR family transcriptional regulator n=1 Tax=Sphingosinicella rhizophila TaxID=3050082 RepID=A0ABU3QCP4_9SPHN|nr:TetR/AcrR family transcriptional regulator [Sphingosinicella sp. GR2756]MDT9600730.1 TetR/AcrR family transcriptional regulator [Sphingosinicella sp. GR2756]